ncbi:hypothetical protein Efla_001320 [Eimeria flavescens]
MAEPQVLPPQPIQPIQQDQLFMRLQQQLRRDLNRLNDANRSTRLHGAKAIFSVYSAESARRAGAKSQDGSSSRGKDSTGDGSNSFVCAYSDVFINHVYGPISALCGDVASESCRATALELLQLVINEFLCREAVVALCSGNRKMFCRSSHEESSCQHSSSMNPSSCCNDSRSMFKSGALRSSNSAAAKPFVAVLAERLKEGCASEETSEELRSLVLRQLQQLVQQYASEPPLLFETSTRFRHHQQKQQQPPPQQEQGWDTKPLADSLIAGVSGALRDRSPSNAVDACRLLYWRPKRFHIRADFRGLSQNSCRPLHVGYKIVLRLTSALPAFRSLLQQETSVQNKLRVVQMLKRLLQEMSHRVLLRPKVHPQLLLLLFILLGDTDAQVGDQAKLALLATAARGVGYQRRCARRRMKEKQEKRSQFARDSARGTSSGSSSDSSHESSSDNSNSGSEDTSKVRLSYATGEGAGLAKGDLSLQQPQALLSELTGVHLNELLADLLPRLTSWSNDERLASLRAVAALLSLTGSQLLSQLSPLLVQLYGFCAAVGGGSTQQRQQQQNNQGPPLLLLVQHAIQRELSGAVDVPHRDSSEPWHCEGLQELGACSSLLCSLQALELSVHCAGLVAMLLPPCVWLPLIAAHLGLQQEALLYISRKKAALSAGAVKTAEQTEADKADAAAEAELRFLEQLPRGYNSVIEALGLNGGTKISTQQRAEALAFTGTPAGNMRHLSSTKEKQHALLLLARMLRSLRLPEEHPHSAEQEALQRSVLSGFRGVFRIREEELALLVGMVEQVQAAGEGKSNLSQSATAAAAAAVDDSGELLPFVAAPLLQLLYAGGRLCKVEAKRLFAASLVQRVDSRSHPEIAKATVRLVCECTGSSPLLLYLSFLEDFVGNELGDAYKEEKRDVELSMAAAGALSADAENQAENVWSCSDTRRLLLLHALHGAQEAAVAEAAAPCNGFSLQQMACLQVLRFQGTCPAAAAAVRADILGACLALFSLQYFTRLAQPYGGWILEHILAPNLRWRPGEANAKIRKVALLCVSQIIPTLPAHTSRASDSPADKLRSAKGEHSKGCESLQDVQKSPTNGEAMQEVSASATSDEEPRKGIDIGASLELLSPLLVSCIDDDWNADVRALAVGVVRQLFLDLQECKEQHGALKQLATATAGPLQQRLDDARDDIRVSAAGALEALLLQCPPLLHRAFMSDVYKQLCICLDDRSEGLASAATAALIAGADINKDLLLEELRGAECRCLYPERYRQLLEKVQQL